jgi:histidyl-tRNA synthetase
MSDRIEVQPISGFPEWLPNVRLQEERFLSTIRQQYQRYGFTPIETPAVERWDVLTAKTEMQRQIYVVSKPAEGADDDADARLGLHFDLTVPLARYVAMNADKLTFPFRRYQIQKVWRGERAQRGRFREFYQCDVDIIGRGALDAIHDAEIPCVINSTFEALGLPEFQIQLSNRKVLADLLRARNLGAEQLATVLRAIDKTDRAGLDATRTALAAENIDAELIPAIVDLIQCRQIADARAVLARIAAPTQGIDELQSVVDSTLALGMPAQRIRPNFAIARGLDYYTGTIYETFIVGSESWGSICSGGRYDDLAGFFTTQKYPGVGISIGLTRLFNLLVTDGHVDVQHKVPTQVLVTMQDRKRYMKEYLELARLLREAGIATEVYLEPKRLRDQFGYASDNGIPLTVIAGESEINAGTVTVKDMRAGTQEVIGRDRLIGYVQGTLARRASEG